MKPKNRKSETLNSRREKCFFFLIKHQLLNKKSTEVTKKNMWGKKLHESLFSLNHRVVCSQIINLIFYQDQLLSSLLCHFKIPLFRGEKMPDNLAKRLKISSFDSFLWLAHFVLSTQELLARLWKKKKRISCETVALLEKHKTDFMYRIDVSCRSEEKSPQ